MKVFFRIFLSFLVAVAVLPALCLGLQCWSCNGISLPGPPDQDVPDSGCWHMLKQYFEGRCVPGETPVKRRCGSTDDVEKEDYVCAKYGAKFEGLEDQLLVLCEKKTEIIDLALGCITDSFENGTVGKIERCYCDTDLCNGTGQIKSHGTAILMMSFIILAAALLQ